MPAGICARDGDVDSGFDLGVLPEALEDREVAAAGRFNHRVQKNDGMKPNAKTKVFWPVVIDSER